MVALGGTVAGTMLSAIMVLEGNFLFAALFLGVAVPCLFLFLVFNKMV